MVVIPTCLLNFFLYRFENKNTYNKYYKFLSREEIPNYNRWQRVFGINLPLLTNPKLLRHLLKDAKKDNKLQLSQNPMSGEEKLIADADYWVKSWEAQFKISLPSPILSEKNTKDIQHNIRLLNEMLHYCVDHGYKPIIVIFPVTKYLSSRFPDQFISNHILKYLVESNSMGVPVLNYLRDDRFSDEMLYINSFFFNKKGRQAFTRAFINDLKIRNIL